MVGFLLASLVIVQLVFGLPRIAQYSAVDEHLWTFDRTPQFWNAIERARWEKTNINDKPGITTAWVSGIGMRTIDPEPYDDLRTESKTSEEVLLMEKINTAFRLPIYLFTLLFVPVYYFLLRKLFAVPIALFSTVFIYLSPILLGISLIINPDSFLWIFLPLSIISFLVFQKEMESRYAYLCGVFLGLALLTKYVSAILYLFLPIIIFFEVIFSARISDVQNYLRQSFTGYSQVLFASLVTVFVLYPATWVDPWIILETTLLSHPFEPIWEYFAIGSALLFADVFLFGSFLSSGVVKVAASYRKAILGSVFGVTLLSLCFVALDTYASMRWYDFQSMLSSARILEETFSLSTIAFRGVATGFFVLIFSVPPIASLAILSMLSSGVFFLWKRDADEEFRMAGILLLFMFLYYVASAMNGVQPTVRYQIALYPLAAILAAIGLHRFLRTFPMTRVVPLFVVGAILIGILSLSLSSIRPYYFSYASELLPNRYVLNMKDMGDGSYEAAQYLNAQEGARDMHIWSDKVAVCEYFIGSCEVSLKPKNIADTHFDYFVISNGREPKTRYFISIRNIVLPEFLRLQELYTSDDFEGHTIVIDDRPGNFVKIVKNSTERK